MQIMVNTDNYIEGGEELTRQVEEVVEDTLGRFDDWLTRVEVRLKDENSDKKEGGNDIRCLMEARPEGLQPLVVTENAATVEQAIQACADTLAKLLNKTKEKKGNHKGQTSYGGDQVI